LRIKTAMFPTAISCPYNTTTGTQHDRYFQNKKSKSVIRGMHRPFTLRYRLKNGSLFSDEFSLLLKGLLT
jgi:hypothetical protein